MTYQGKFGKLDFTKIVIFSSLKDTARKIKRQAKNGKIFANDILDKASEKRTFKTQQ